MNRKYNKTVYACFTGYVVQAIVNSFAPLLFLTFEREYDIPIDQITILITINFGIQLIVDLLSALFIDRIGYRIAAILAHTFSAAGLVGMSFLPDLLPSSFAGLLICVVIYALGGGLLEVIISPIVESCPTQNKEKAMSLLHSFYCWGYVAVVLLSTVFFHFFGIDNWRIVTCLWAIIPIANGIVFSCVPIAPLIAKGEKGLTLKELLGLRIFWLLVMMMVCSGASEQAVSQWASVFAEKGLGVTKAIGDLAGPMAFAIMQGASRAIYGKWGDRMNLDRFMGMSAVLCVISYLLISLSPYPVLSMIGCAVCGLSVGIMWPGCFSKASASIKNGGTAMFALLALAGDLGCSSGPTLVGTIASFMNDNLKPGIIAAIIFPMLFLLGLWTLWNRKRPQQ